LKQQLHHPQHHSSTVIPQRRIDYAEIQFKPKVNEQAEV
jgi:hypothetical protein